MNDPVLIAVTGRKRKNGKMSWTRVGHAYPHDKGSGLNLSSTSCLLRAASTCVNSTSAIGTSSRSDSAEANAVVASVVLPALPKPIPN
jgi:hypothetical protein